MYIYQRLPRKRDNVSAMIIYQRIPRKRQCLCHDYIPPMSMIIYQRLPRKRDNVSAMVIYQRLPRKRANVSAMIIYQPIPRKRDNVSLVNRRLLARRRDNVSKRATREPTRPSLYSKGSAAEASALCISMYLRISSEGGGRGECQRQQENCKR